MAHEFRLEEYKALRGEIADQIKAGDMVKVYVTVVVAAYYSFLSTELIASDAARKVSLVGPLWAWILPIFFPLAGMLRLKFHIDQMTIFSEYLKRIERKYTEPLLGWEHYYSTPDVKAMDRVWYSDFIYFGLLLLFATWVAVVRFYT
ncbi:MAG TPA: hypothetical protein VN240_04860 [Propylenella sp.]|nr:hypothetical protein [Propylenella sp.]